MSMLRASAPASSRAGARNRALAPGPGWFSSRLFTSGSLKVSEVSGVITDSTPATSARSSVIAPIVLRFSPSNRSATSASASLAVNSKITVSPPNLPWNSRLSIAVCESGLR